MAEENTDKKLSWSIRTSKRVRKQLKEMALREGRTLNNQVELILCKAAGLDIHKEI